MWEFLPKGLLQQHASGRISQHSAQLLCEIVSWSQANFGGPERFQKFPQTPALLHSQFCCLRPKTERFFLAICFRKNRSIFDLTKHSCNWRCSCVGSSSLGLFCHVPLKRDRWNWNWRLWDGQLSRELTFSESQPILFEVSFLQSQISINNLVLYVSFATFRWKEKDEIEIGGCEIFNWVASVWGWSIGSQFLNVFLLNVILKSQDSILKKKYIRAWLLRITKAILCHSLLRLLRITSENYIQNNFWELHLGLWSNVKWPNGPSHTESNSHSVRTQNIVSFIDLFCKRDL